MPHRDPKVTVDLARLQSPFIVAPGNERRRRPSPLVHRPPPHVVHITITTGHLQNLAGVNSLRRTSPET
jgi:hypothetical protein